MNRAPRDCLLPRCDHLRSDVPYGEQHDSCAKRQPMNGQCTEHSHIRQDGDATAAPLLRFGRVR